MLGLGKCTLYAVTDKKPVFRSDLIYDVGMIVNTESAINTNACSLWHMMHIVIALFAPCRTC